jgi:UDP-2,3-diacylglucosamine pyrophosphatase LpxH
VKHLAIHGHQFDRFLSRNRVLSTFLASIHLGLQKFAFGKKRMIGFLERFDTAWLRLSSKVAAGALAYGKTKNVQRVFCGHTHEAVNLTRDGVEYYNTGSWTQDSATYVIIEQQGVRVCEYREASEDLLQNVLNQELEVDFEDLMAE